MKKRKPHNIPLTKQSLALLELLRPISGHREFLFLATRPEDPYQRADS